MPRIHKSELTSLREILASLKWMVAEGDMLELGDGSRWLVVGVECGGHNELGGCKDVIISATSELVEVEVPCHDSFYHWWKEIALVPLPLPPEGVVVRWLSKRWGGWTPNYEEVVSCRWSGDPPKCEVIEKVTEEEIEE